MYDRIYKWIDDNPIITNKFLKMKCERGIGEEGTSKVS